MPTFVVFRTLLAHFGPIPGRPPHQSQKKSLRPQNSRCPDRIGTRHIIKKNTHQDQIFAFFWSFSWLIISPFFSRPDGIGTGSYSIGTLFLKFWPSSLQMTTLNIPKCISNYYTSVKVGSYSIGTVCTGSYSIGTLFFGKNLVGSYSIGTLWRYIHIYIYIHTGCCLYRA